MSQPKITLYVDIVSPFAYIAFYILKNSPVFKQCEITYIPILLGGLMKACGNTAPINIKNKDKWINAERHRWATHFQIPISATPPPGFPVNTLNIQRALVSLSLSHPDKLEHAIALFYEAFWVRWDEPTRPEKIHSVLTTVLGSGEEADKVMQAEGVKGVLSGNTEKAFRDGAFGLPWFVATNKAGETEGYWGVDHMGQMCDHLGLDRPTGKGWRSLL
ncbi:HCCA isomerase/glutathione S-transferase kappa [Decorospora gaudefroyi]|uniref:Glutathione S-transferase kappa n=1 Tax=Decorospora gaudefroyi TaxID=184978 RepID=A0A6A5KJX6_9PLEO|nr:HCCA isomerase/glutathione S-transferase kappa [Decorospora gaudefroyi]